MYIYKYIFIHYLYKYDENPNTKNITDFTCQYSPHKYENV